MVKASFWSLSVAAAIGLAYHLAAAYFWGIYASGNPIHDALLHSLVRQGYVVQYRVVISIHDIVVNLLLALPYAAAFRFIRALRSWTHVALAVIAALVAGYGPMEWGSLPLLLRHWTFWLGLLMAGLWLHLAFALLSHLRCGELRAGGT